MGSEYISASAATQTAYAYFLETQGGADYDANILPVPQGPAIETNPDGKTNEDSVEPMVQEAVTADENDVPIEEIPIVVGDENSDETVVTEGEN